MRLLTGWASRRAAPAIACRTSEKGRGETLKTALLAIIVIVGVLAAVIFTTSSRAIAEIAQAKNVGEVPAGVGSASFLGFKPATDEIRLLISFDLRDGPGLERTLAELNDPKSPSYQHWLSPEEYGRRFGRSQEQIDHAVAWLKAGGMDVDRIYSNHVSIGFSGTVAAVQDTFHVQLAMYSEAVTGRVFYSNTTKPTLPREIETMTSGLLGLNDAVILHAEHADLKQITAQQIAAGSYAPPQQFSIDYNYAPLWGMGIQGAGQSVAVVMDSDVLDSDINTYSSTYGLPPIDLQRPAIFPASAGKLTTDQDESTCDVLSVSAAAPLAEVDLVVVPSLFSTYTDTADEDIINGNTIKLVSESFGGCESGFAGSSEVDMYNQAVSQGIVFFASVGDDGSSCGVIPYVLEEINCPACYPGVVAVGGTTLNPPEYQKSRAKVAETVWEATCRDGQIGVNQGGGSGGISKVWPIPSFQSEAQGFTGGVPAGSFRTIPDVAAIADPSGGGTIVLNGMWYGIGGTSESSPLWAGMMALINERKGSTGNGNAFLYQLGINQYNFGGIQSFYDVTAGANALPACGAALAVPGYSATVGYDLVSGWGTPNINQIAGGVTIPPPPPPTTLSLSSATLASNGAVVTTAPAGQSGLTVTVIGTGFISGSSFMINGNPVDCVFSPTETVISLGQNTAVLKLVGPLVVTAQYGTAPTTTSNSITAGTLTGPAISSATATLNKTSGAIVLKVLGQDFQAGDSVSVAIGSDLPVTATTFISPGALKAKINHQRITAGTVLSVVVITPAAVSSNSFSVTLKE
jgi:subtilase family serine protease